MLMLWSWLSQQRMWQEHNFWLPADFDPSSGQRRKRTTEQANAACFMRKQKVAKGRVNPVDSMKKHWHE